MSSIDPASRPGKILGILVAAAAAGTEPPLNTEIGERLGFAANLVPNYMKVLVKAGEIAIEKHGRSRAITILSTGKVTSNLYRSRPRPKSALKSKQDLRREVAKADARREKKEGERNHAATALTFIPLHKLAPVETAPPLRPNDRRVPAASNEPCLRCGIPGFRGCAHQLPYERSEEFAA